jgi:hypothetical protein
MKTMIYAIGNVNSPIEKALTRNKPIITQAVVASHVFSIASVVREWCNVNAISLEIHSKLGNQNEADWIKNTFTKLNLKRVILFNSKEETAIKFAILNEILNLRIHLEVIHVQ